MDALYSRFETLLYKLARVMSQCSAGESDRLPVPHYMMMRVLADKGPIRVSELAEQIGAKPSAASMLLNALDEAGYIHRETDPTDRRATLVSLSDTGRARVEAVDEKRRGFMHTITSRLTPEQLDSLIVGLDAVAEAVMQMRATERGDDTEDTEGT